MLKSSTVAVGLPTSHSNSINFSYVYWGYIIRYIKLQYMIAGQEETDINEMQCTDIKHLYYYPPTHVLTEDMSDLESVTARQPDLIVAPEYVLT